MESRMGWLFLLCWHCFISHFSFSHSLCHPQDSLALLQFKTSFTVHTTYCNDCFEPITTWENGTDCCSWSGITCHPISGHVIGLDLSFSRVNTEIHPNNTLFHLTHLTHLSLPGYSIQGEIPPQISLLSKLESLDLSFNDQLKWKESTWKKLLKNATVLRELLLDETDMYSTSMMPLNLSSSLVTLGLAETGVKGNLADNILCLPNLKHLYLSLNYNLQGQLPKVSCSTYTLSVLDLSNCQFQGSIPPSFFNLTHLTSLRLSWNNLNGSIPSSLSNLQHLILLDLSWNQFSGAIPNVFASITKLNTPNLTSLDLSQNNLKGSIPSSLLSLPRLTFLNLQANLLSHQIPNVFQQSNKFEVLDLSINNIGGELPSTLSNLQCLIHLDISENKLSGQIPDVFAGLTKLNTLNLMDNNLIGKIPSSLFDLTQLSLVDFSYNRLEGPLPNKITGFLNVTTLRFENNLLNGTIPSWCLSLPSVVHLDLSNNQFTGHISAISSYSLQSLFLCNNNLQGNIPESIFSLENLTDLCLSSNNLSGSVHFPLFSKLQNLQNLSLSHNNQLSLNFKSNVNYSFPFLRSLSLSSMGLTEFPKLSVEVPTLGFLDLSNNKLSGRVPNWLHEMSSLYQLDLSRNLLTAALNQFSRNYMLFHLDLSFNLLTGGISSSICNASMMMILNLSHNKLIGILPQCFSNLSNLEILDLQKNKLHGTLQSTFSKNKWLSSLNLNSNQFEGILPKSLTNCSNLEFLNLGNNQFEDTFPHWLRTLPHLKVLVLKANKLHGPIVSLKTKHPFRSLVIFDISSNNFSGPIPKAYIKSFEAMTNVAQDKVVNNSQEYLGTDIGNATYSDSVTVTMKAISLTLNKIPINFVNIDLSGNKFEEEIPNVIGELHALRGLNLSHNRLSGPIPQSMGNLTNLESLDLSSNMLIGGIPSELTNLNFLEVLNLSHNHLVGEIPQGKQFNTFSNDSYEENFGLCGVPLSMTCIKDPEQHSSPSQTFWREKSFGFGWKPVAIGYGCGMIFGVGIGYCVLLTGKPRWLVKIVAK
ncbi:receptor-like protein 34 [Cajanus cajan]|uniref:receptor-like protein 34 n=1 Tax=Cajanus cajan TaxID=3821 RepID=UPI0010FB355B|nr:receptor-like protein 34 [Cajanus cajan]